MTTKKIFLIYSLYLVTLIINLIYVLLLKNKFLISINWITAFILAVLPALAFSLTITYIKSGKLLAILLVLAIIYNMVFAMRIKEGDIELFPIVYHAFAAKDSILNNGRLDINEISNIFNNFKEYPLILLFYSLFELISGVKINHIATHLSAILYPIIKIPLTFYIFKHYVKKDVYALYSAIWSTFYLNGYHTFLSYSEVSMMIIIVALYFAFKIKVKINFISIILVGIAVIMHIIPPIGLFWILLIFSLHSFIYKGQKNRSLPEWKKFFALTLIILLLIVIKLSYYGVNTLQEIVSIITMVIPEKEFLSVPPFYSAVIMEPFKVYLNIFIIIGQSLLGILAFYNIVRYILKHKIDVLTLGGIALSSYIFVPNWYSLNITDLYLRVIPYITILIAPGITLGYVSLTKLMYRLKNLRKIVHIFKFLIVFLVVSSCFISLPTYVYFRNYPIRSDEPIALPNEWYSVGCFFYKFYSHPITLWGTFQAYFIKGLLGEENIRFYVGISQVMSKSDTYLALSRLNFILPDARFVSNRSLSLSYYFYLVNNLNLIYQSDNLLIFA